MPLRRITVKSVIVMNGALSNVIDYAMKPNSQLTGTFNLTSGLIVADDFMAFADGPPAAAAKPAASSAKSAARDRGGIGSLKPQPHFYRRCEESEIPGA